jgi:prevent-host-death family protein
MQTVSIEEARRTIGDLVDRARLAGEPTMITRYNKPGAVVVGAEWYAEAQEALEAMADGPGPAHRRGARP